MSNGVALIIVIFILMTTYLLGYGHGRIHQRQVCEEEQERLDLIDPPRRTAGMPANTEAPPSEIREPRWRSGRFRDGPDTADPRE